MSNMPLEFKKGDFVMFTISVDYNRNFYASHGIDTLKLSPKAASDVVRMLTECLEWYSHPVYRWAKQRTGG